MMRRIATGLFFIIATVSAAYGQTTCTSTLTQSQVLTSFADNNTGAITPRKLRDYVCSQTSGSIPFAPSPSTTQQGLQVNMFPSGTVAGAFVGNSFNCGSAATPENLNVTSLTIADCFKVNHVFGGSAMVGTRQAIEGYATLQSASSTTNPTRFYIGGAFTAEAVSSDTGVNTTLSSGAAAGATSLTVTSINGIRNGDSIQVQLNVSHYGNIYFSTVVSGSPSGSTVNINPGLPSEGGQTGANSGNAVVATKGEFQGAIGQAIIDSGVSNISAAAGLEANLSVKTGAGQPLAKALLILDNNSDDQVKGLSDDTMVLMSSSTGAVTFDSGIHMGPHSGQFPLSTTGKFIDIVSNSTIGTLISAPYITISNFIINTPNFTVTGGGDIVTVGSISSTSTLLLNAGAVAGSLLLAGTPYLYWNTSTFSPQTNNTMTLGFATSHFNAAYVNAYFAGASDTAGVSCSGSPTPSFASVNGIVTSC